MERPLTITAVEDAIVRHCAAVLLNARPASMFTFVGDFASPQADDPVPAACALQGEKCRATVHGSSPCNASVGDVRRSRVSAHGSSPTAGQRARRTRLTQLLKACEQQPASDGIRIRVLTWRPCGAIVYVYRPSCLARSLKDPRVTRALAQMGYHVAGGELGACTAAGSTRAQAETRPRPEMLLAHVETYLDALLDQLGSRFSCAAGLPHEIGFFLGYPYEDVMGFIEHRGRNFICFGCWKVYANPRQALRSFSRFKRCARRAERLRRNGATLADLARPATQRRNTALA